LTLTAGPVSQTVKNTSIKNFPDYQFAGRRLSAAGFFQEEAARDRPGQFRTVRNSPEKFRTVRDTTAFPGPGPASKAAGSGNFRPKIPDGPSGKLARANIASFRLRGQKEK
jgi:hypothetical protein